MIKAVIFDCFGVLTADRWLAFCDVHFSHNDETLEHARALNHRVDAGLIAYSDFVDQVAELAGVSAADTWRELTRQAPNEPLLAYIRDSVKPQYAVGMLSNAAENWLDTLFEQWHVALFDQVVLSCDVGATKPEAIMYETIAAKLGCLPEECLFIDDQPRFVVGAQDIGMKGSVFTDTKSFIQEFEEIIS